MYLSVGRPQRRRPSALLLAVILLHVGLLCLGIMHRAAVTQHAGEQVTYMDLRAVALPVPTKQAPTPPVNTPSKPQPDKVTATTRHPVPAHVDNSITLIEKPTPIENTAPASIAEERHLDLDKLRKFALEDDRKHELTPVEQLQKQQRTDRSLEAKLAPGIDQATRNDCRTAYAGTGLLAPLFILKDVASNKTCKW